MCVRELRRSGRAPGTPGPLPGGMIQTIGAARRARAAGSAERDGCAAREGHGGGAARSRHGRAARVPPRHGEGEDDRGTAKTGTAAVRHGRGRPRYGRRRERPPSRSGTARRGILSAFPATLCGTRETCGIHRRRPLYLLPASAGRPGHPACRMSRSTSPEFRGGGKRERDTVRVHVNGRSLSGCFRVRRCCRLPGSGGFGGSGGHGPKGAEGSRGRPVPTGRAVPGLSPSRGRSVRASSRSAASSRAAGAR